MKSKSNPASLKTAGKRNVMKDLGMGIAGIIAVIYLLNPDAGIIELIPDNIPLIGNLDEVAATVLLLRVFRYFNWSLPGLFKKREKP